MYYNFLQKPSVPPQLILSLSEVLQLENIFGGESKDYTIHECQEELAEYLKIIFPEYTKFRYQTLKKGVPIHVDFGRTRAVNYIIDTGGPDVKTIWYNSTPIHDKIPVFDIVLPAKVWHELKVDVLHTVMNIETTRYAITVY